MTVDQTEVTEQRVAEQSFCHDSDLTGPHLHATLCQYYFRLL